MRSHVQLRKVPNEIHTLVRDSPLTLNLTLTETGDFIVEALENAAGVRVDYVPGSSAATVTIPANHLYLSVQFSTEDDAQIEANGSIKIELAEGPGYTIGDDDEATVNVRDNDLGISIADATANEGDANIAFRVSLSGTSEETVTVVVSTVDGRATSGETVTATSLGKDFEAKSETLTFAPSETEKTFTVTLVDDTFDEYEESFAVELSRQSDNAGLSDSSATAVISDNDNSMVVGVYREGKTVNEDAGGPVIFRFELTPQDGSNTTAAELTTEVHWALIEGTATAGEDYVPVESTVKTQLLPGVLSKAVGVIVLDDEVYEKEFETFTFDLKSALNLDLDPDHQSIVVSLRDNETLQAGAAPDSENVAEGDVASFTVTLTPFENAVPVEIEYEVAGTAGPADYTAPSGTLTIPAGESSARITIDILADTLHDPDETIGVLLANATGGGREIILNTTDTPPMITILDSSILSASIASGASADEGGAIEFTINLTTGTDRPVLIEWSTSDAQGDGAAESGGVDYTDASGTVTIAAGDTSGTFTVSTVEDSLVEGDETFIVVLSSAEKGEDPQTSTPVDLGISSATATIVDDDTAPTSITLTATPDRVDEDAGETDLSVTATLDGSTRLASDVTVDLGLEGSIATGQGSSEPDSVTLTIPAGQASGTATVPMTPANDEIAGGDDGMVSIVGTATGFDITGATVTIDDDDEAPTGVILTLSHSSLSEGAVATDLTVTATLTGGDRRPEATEIPLSVAGVSIPATEENGEPTTAAANDDYTAASATLTIAEGEATGTATLKFAPTADNLVEGDETVQVSGTSPGLVVTPALLTIEDDDREPDGIQLSATPDGVSEDDENVQIQVTATLVGGGVRTEDTAVTLSVHDASAAAGADYTAGSGLVLVIPAGQVSGTASLSITLVDDDIYEDTETLAIRGSNEDPGLSVRGVRISIADDEERPTEILLVLDRDTVAEDGGSQPLEVTAIVQGDSKRDIPTQVSLSFAAPTTDSSAEGKTTKSTTISSKSEPPAGHSASARDFSAFVSTLTIPAGGSEGETVVVLSPIDDSIDEEDESLEVRGSTPDLKVSAALVTITDDDVAGVTITPTDLAITEGDSGAYSVVLDTQPIGDVTIEVAVPKGSDVAVESAMLTFTPSNWDTAQTVTVTANQDDDGADEDETTLSHTVGGADYEDVTADGVTVSVTDDDRGIVFNPTSLTVEEGDADGETYTVKLATEPSEEVTVTVSGQAGTDLSLTGLSAASTLTFTTSNWNAAQTVTVKAAQDGDDGDDEVTLTHTAAGGNYAEVSSDLAVTLTDDDTLGVVVDPTAITVQAGGSNSYIVVLGTLPSGDVTVTVSGEDGTDLTLNGLSAANTLIFTTANWDTPQTVSVEAADDATTAEITLSQEVSSAADSAYDTVIASDVEVTLLAPGDKIQIQLGVDTSAQTLTVSEGDSRTYQVVLSHRPSGDVSVVVNDPTDNSDVTASPDSLTFTADNWNIAQTVTVSAAHDDDGSDESATVTHSVSGGGYDGVSAPDIEVTVTDDDRGIVFDPTSLTVPEGDATGATYTVKLATEPSEEVTVTVSGQAGTDLSLTGLSANTLTFTTSNWDTAQTVTVKAGEDDDGSDDSVTLAHAAAGGNYAGASGDLKVTVADDDRGIVFNPTSLTVTEGDADGETYTVKLATQPSAEVTVTVSGQGGTDLTLSGLSSTNTLTFTTSNWDTAQTVTVKAAEDDDGTDDTVTLTHTAAGGNYAGASGDLKVTVDDDDRGIVFNPTSLTVTEGDADGETYTVKLATQPSEEVTVTVSGQAGTDLTLSGLTANTLTFTTSNWDTAQTVTVKAGEDDDGSDDTVTLAHAAAGGNYAGASGDLEVTVTDDDRDIVFNPTSLTVEEGDATGATYTVKLATQPSEGVTVTVSGQAGTDLMLSGLTANTLTFTTSNWDTAQTVTVKAAEDDDGSDDTVTLTHTAAGGDYAGASGDLEVTVTDDDRGIVLSPTSLTVDEGDTTGATYTVKLATQPSEDVTVTVSGHNGTDVTLNKTTLTFTTSNWGTAQTVTVKAAEDDDGTDDTVTLTHTAAGGNYAGASGDLKVTVADDDRGIVFNPTSLTVDEGDATGATYTVKLATEPSAEVTVTVSGQAGTDLMLSGLSSTNTLTFTTSNWDTAQTVTVKAAEDDDGSDDSVTLTHAAAGGNYAGASGDLKVTVADDDRGIVFNPTSLTVDEGDATGATYTVKLATEPSEGVTVTVSGQGGTDLMLSGLTANTLTFTTSNWDTAQTVTVKAAEDDDGTDDTVTLTHTAAGGNYAGASGDLKVTVADDDKTPLLSAVHVSFANSAQAIPEGGTATVVVSLSDTLAKTVTIPLTKTNQAGAVDADYSSVPASLTFSAGDTEQSFTVSATVDSEDEEDEEVVLGFGTLPEGVGQGTVNQTTITILDVPSVSFGASDYSATEGGEDAVVTVLLSEPLPADVTVPLTAEGGGGATPDDWSGVPTQVTFSADETSKTFTLVAVDDTVEDDGEMVNLGFGTLPAGLNAGSPATATVTLMNVEESMNSCDENDVWCATIYLEAWDTHPPYDVYHNADWRNGNTGWYEVDRQFTYGGITYEVRGVGFLPDPMPNAAYNSTFSLWFNHYRMNPRLYSPPSEDHVAQWRLHVGDGIQLHFGDATRVGDSHYIWHGAKFRPLSRGGTTLDLRIERIVGQDDIHHYTPVTPNSRPTGELVVTGAPRAGNTLTMDASGISDPDGMVDSDIQYFWWVQYPQYSSEVAKGATYVVQPKYEGKPIYAQITFTDDAGRREHVNSARTERVCVEGGEIEPCQTQEPEDIGNAPVENTAATGLPAISGTPAVGETLTADTSDIEDVNGLTNAGFAFQWSRYDGTTRTDITGATSSTYTVQNDDIGNQLLVTVSFTDDDGNQESLTSSSVYIQSPQPLYGGFDESTVPDHHDGSNAFTFQIHFSEEPELNDVNVRDYVLTVTGGQVISASPTDPDSETPHMRWTITVRPSGNTDVTVLLPPTTDCEDQGAVCTSLGKMLINRTAITVPGPDQQQQKDDDGGIVFNPTSLTVEEGDADGETYTVKLATQPSEEVTVTVSGQAGTDLSLTGLSAANTLTFTTSNWDTAQTVTVTGGQDDDGSDDSATLTHTAAGGNYEGVSSDLTVTVTDDDGGIVFNPISLTVEEGDATGATYTVKLATEPSEEVTVTVSGQSGTDLSLTGLSAANTLTFTTSNWDTAQTVTVTGGQDDDGSDDSVTLTHTAAGGNYEGVSSDLTVTVTDDDGGIVFNPISLTVEEGDTTGATYTVKLATEPSEEVTVTVSGQSGTDLSLTGLSAANTLTFTTSNWDTAQTVTVTGGQDDDGSDDTVTLTHTAAGGNYEGVSSDLTVTVTDDDRGIMFNPASLTVEEGDADGETYTVKLATEPSEEVTVTVSGHDASDLTLSGLSSTNTLTFTTSNWDTAQTVTVTGGQDDDGSDDSVTLTHTAVGGNYAGASGDLKVTVTDDDGGIVFNPTSLTVEEGDADGETYTVKLAAEPSEEVTVTVSGQAGTDLSLTGLSAASTLTFTTSNWDTAQTVTVTGGQDDDGSDDSVTLTHTAAGGNYEGVSSDLTVTVTDDDGGIVFNPTSLTVEEGDTTGATYTVKLATEPSEEVTVTVSGHDASDLTLSGLSSTNTLTFTTSNWDTAQTVTVTAGQDDDGSDDSVTLTHTAAEGDYAGASGDLKVTVADDDRGIVFNPTSLTVEEGDADGETYTVKLATAPSEEVTVTVSGHNGTDVTLNKTTLTFTTSNWDTAQTVTVKAGEDDDGSDDTVTLTHAAAGGNYEGVSSDLAVTVADDEKALSTSAQVNFTTNAHASPTPSPSWSTTTINPCPPSTSNSHRCKKGQLWLLNRPQPFLKT